MEGFFDVLHEDATGLARTGVVHLAHGDVRTPVFMPVGTRGTVKAVSWQDMEQMGFEIVLSNTYHLYLRPGAGIVSECGGLHGFTGWHRNFLTDSGGFQVFSLSSLRNITAQGVAFKSHIDGSKHLFTPESVVDTQVQLNSDIQMQLDVCSGYGVDRAEAEHALRVTSDWAVRAVLRWNQAVEQGYRGALFPIVQGNFFDDLRKESAQFVSSLDVPGVAIGGLSVGEPADVFVQKLAFTAQFLPRSKPRYVMGIGTPQYILEAIENGIDMFDCVLPTRNARNGSYFTHHGMLSIKQERFSRDQRPIDAQCTCKVCRTYSRAYLRHLFKEQEMLSAMLASYHNLYFLNQLVLDARVAIGQDRFSVFKAEFLKQFESGDV